MGNNTIYKNVKKIIGILLIILGVFGLFLPFLQGFLFIAIGLFMLGEKSTLKKIKKWWLWLKKKIKLS